MFKDKIIQLDAECDCCQPCDCCPCITGVDIRVWLPSCCGLVAFVDFTVPLVFDYENPNKCVAYGNDSWGGAFVCNGYYADVVINYQLNCVGGKLRLDIVLYVHLTPPDSGPVCTTTVRWSLLPADCKEASFKLRSEAPVSCTIGDCPAELACTCSGWLLDMDPILDTTNALCGPCQYVKNLRSTGIPDTVAGPSADADGNICHKDLYWLAAGVPARLVAGTVSYGCPSSAWISTLCDATASDAGTNGGPDGAEIIFKTTFFIEADADLSRILISGEYSADNYVKAGHWKVNGIDQCQIYHGTYYTRIALDCIQFEIDNSQGQFVHGTNTVEITVKNGNWTSPTYGGPMMLALRWACFTSPEPHDGPMDPADCITEPVDPGAGGP